jgi:Tol biopolymer transport system component
LAFTSIDEHGQRLVWVRRLESLESRSLPGTDRAQYPFWSPDGRSIGFFAGDKVKKVGVDGTPPEILCENPTGLARGGTWGRDGEILFAAGGHSIYRVSAAGGEPKTVYARSEESGYSALLWPSFLPDGRHFVFLNFQYGQDRSAEDHILLGSLDSNETVPLIEASSNAVYAPPGYLLYTSQGKLLAQPFDAKRLRIEGEPTPLAGGLKNAGVGHWGFSVSDTGVLSYSSGSAFRPTWFDRLGRNLGVIGEPTMDCFDVRLSPDEMHVAMTCADPEIGSTDVRLLDLERNASSRLTSDPMWDQWPVWSPRGERIAFWSQTELRQRLIDRPGDLSVLLSTKGSFFRLTDWSLDGRLILYQTHERGVASDLFVVNTDGSGKTEPVLSSRFSEIDGRFSPDGRWLAYASDESGRFEVYVQPFPAGDRRYQVSFEGGRRPHWRGDGKELFYVAGDSFLVAVPVQVSPAFQLGEEETLFRTMLPIPAESRFSVSKDGQRFLLYSSTSPGAMNVILNWPALLER